MKKKIKLDAYEREIERNIGKGQKVENEEELKEKLVQAAKNYMAERRSITIRVQNKDLSAIKLKASQMGIPYQTYINILIHRDAINQN